MVNNLFHSHLDKRVRHKLLNPLIHLNILLLHFGLVVQYLLAQSEILPRKIWYMHSNYRMAPICNQSQLKTQELLIYRDILIRDKLINSCNCFHLFQTFALSFIAFSCFSFVSGALFTSIRRFLLDFSFPRLFSTSTRFATASPMSEFIPNTISWKV